MKQCAMQELDNKKSLTDVIFVWFTDKQSLHNSHAEKFAATSFYAQERRSVSCATVSVCVSKLGPCSLQRVRLYKCWML